ncbi:DgyrCDS9569 [Dimorphilus gyrociliatus]|uniref:DgyrCDS9569 n=1 Tax=Dimorphilus gyrociliatus TaxID=2664684 RepID=A0A7I8VYP1_9ANNE|nr:DgyrCDS9569 [Dimorphilus gyrociliatus]
MNKKKLTSKPLKQNLEEEESDDSGLFEMLDCLCLEDLEGGENKSINGLNMEFWNDINFYWDYRWLLSTDRSDSRWFPRSSNNTVLQDIDTLALLRKFLLNYKSGIEQDHIHRYILGELNWLIEHRKFLYMLQKEDIIRREIYYNKALAYSLNGLGIPLYPQSETITQVINMRRLSFSTFEVQTAATIGYLEEYSFNLQQSFESSPVYYPDVGDFVIVKSDMYYRATVKLVFNTECLVQLTDIIGDRMIQFHNIREIPEMLALQPILIFKATFRLLQIFDFLDDNQAFNTLLDYSIRRPGTAIINLMATGGMAMCKLLINGHDMIMSIICEFFQRFHYIHRSGDVMKCIYSSMSGNYGTVFVQHNLNGLEILDSFTKRLIIRWHTLKTLTFFKPGDFGVVMFKGKPHRAIVQNSECGIHRLVDVGTLVQTPRLFCIPDELKVFPPQAVEIPVIPEDQHKIIEMQCGTPLQLLNTYHWYKLVEANKDFP